MKIKNLTQNTTFYTLALILQKILSFFYFWYISSALVPSELGKYIFALSFTTLFSVFTDLGLAPILTRESSKKKELSNSYLQNAIGIKALLCACVMVVIFFTLIFTKRSVEIQFLVFLAALLMIIDTFTVALWSTFRSYQNLFFESLATVLVQICILFFGIIFIKIYPSVSFLIIALILASIVNAVFAVCVAKIKLGLKLTPRWDKKIIAYLFSIIPVFAVGGISVKIYNASDSVLLGYLIGEHAVGLYAVPAKVITALAQILPMAFVTALFPVMSMLFVHSKDKLSELFQTSVRYLIIISLPITFGLFAVIPSVLSFFWPQYIESLGAFLIMTAGIPFIFLAFPTGNLLNACDLQKKNTKNRLITMVLSIGANIILIPLYGISGAALTYFLSSVLLFVFDLYSLPKNVLSHAGNIFSTFLKSLISSIIMFVAVFVMGLSIHFLISITFGFMLYFILLFLLKGITMNEIKKVFLSIREKTI